MRNLLMATASIFLWAIASNAETVCLANLDSSGNWQIQHRFSPADFNGQEDVHTSLLSHIAQKTKIHGTFARLALSFHYIHHGVDRYEFPAGTVLHGSRSDGSSLQVELISINIDQLAGMGIWVKGPSSTSGLHFLAFTCT